MQKCKRCQEIKPFTEFTKDKKQPNEKSIHCKSCIREYNSTPERKATRIANATRWQKNHPEREAVTRRKQRLHSKYGLTPTKFEQMWNQQHGKCGICLEPMERDNGNKGAKSCHVDHDHVTNTVRELLCADCNLGISRFHESQFKLSQAISYLRRSTT